MSDDKNNLPTRTSLLRQVKNESDHTKWEQGWEEFYSIYRPLIFGVARQARLNVEEAEDVVQEVMAELRRRIQGFEPNRERGPFKAWLLNLVRWRIADQLRKRLPVAEVAEGDTEAALRTQASIAAASKDSCSDEAWEAAVRQRLLEEAIDRVKAQADEKQFQIFRVYTSQKISAQQVAQAFGVSIMQVYLAKHRLGKMIKKEIAKLERVTSQTGQLV